MMDNEMHEENPEEFPPEEIESLEQEGETLNFRVRRSHFYAVMVPIFFLLGLAAGFLIWGRDANSEPLIADADSGSSAVAQPTEAQSLDEIVAEQIPTLTRHEIEIGEQDPAEGPQDAPITLVEFADYECPYCTRYFEEVLPQLKAAYGDQIRFVYKDFPLTSIHPNALSAALAAHCAGEQDSFWDYHDLLFASELGLSSESYTSYAEQLGLDLEQFSTCYEEQRYLESVEGDVAEASEIGLSSTPTFFINGLVLVGAQPFEVFEAIIEYELANPVEN